jgi:branched-chain amino acid transport system ATP-binding protein
MEAPASTQASEVLLQARSVTKHFGGVAALQGVDVEIRRGEILGVIGPNGAGKTTFVNCISGLDRPSSGTIRFKGIEITKMPSYQIGRLGLARTFQVVKPLRQLNVIDNVAIGAMFGAGGRKRSTAQARQRAEQVLEQLGLKHRSTHLAADLTLPDLKRLELAKALAMDPELLFLDEVMAGLNPTEIEHAMQMLQSINSSGITLFVIEHVMKAIMGISDRIVVLHFGKKIAEGDPGRVIENPQVIEAYLGERFAKRARSERQKR